MYNQENGNIRICLITPGHIATNPRLVKEAEALLEAGYMVHVIFTQYMDYLLTDDEQLLLKYPGLTYNRLSWVKKKNLLRISSGVIQKLSQGLLKAFTKCTTLHKIMLNRHYLWQYRQALKIEADLYIAHNSGALAIAADAARKKNVRFGFDAEDFHREEGLSNAERESLVHIENQYMPLASHLTSASTLIGKAYEKIYLKKFITILNVFPKQQFKKKTEEKRRALQLFWFSQTIGTGRGLENIIEAISLLEDKSPVLHLLGDVSLKMKVEIEQFLLNKGLKKENLIFYDPVFPDKIFEMAANFDIGIAAELSVPLNRNICLTNKIFTYIQAGLAVAVSDTSAQADLFRQHPNMGGLYQNSDIHSLSNLLKNYQLFPEMLVKAKEYNIWLGENLFNWDLEKIKFLDTLKSNLKL